MPGTDLKMMIDEVKDGRMDRRAFIQRMIGLGLTAPMATQILAEPKPLSSDKTRWRWPVEAVVVAGADLAQSAFRHRDQGSGRLAPVL